MRKNFWATIEDEISGQSIYVPKEDRNIDAFVHLQDDGTWFWEVDFLSYGTCNSKDEALQKAFDKYREVLHYRQQHGKTPFGELLTETKRR